MATSCNSGACNELITIGDRFQYSVQIIGENGRPKTIHENKWVVMEDVECYTILLRQKCLDKSTTLDYAPCVSVTIDGQRLGLFVFPAVSLEIDRFPNNGDVVCFVACRQPDSKFENRPSAFQCVSPDNMGLIRLDFGVCRDSAYGKCEAYTVTGNVPKVCKFSSDDVKPLLEGLDLQCRKGGFDEPDCGAGMNPTIAGGLLRLSNSNTRMSAQEMLHTCAVTQYDTGCLTVRLVGASKTRATPANGKNIEVKNSLGSILAGGSEQWAGIMIPPKANLVF